MENASPPPMSSPHASPEGSASSGKKFFAVGCGALVLVLFIAGLIGYYKVKSLLGDFLENPQRAMVEVIVRANPDLEMISHDTESGTATLRYLPDGSEITVSYDDLAQGRITWETEDGRVVLGMQTNLNEHRSWATDLIPAGASEMVGLMIRESASEFAGMIQFQWNLSPEDALQAVQEKLQANGFEISSHQQEQGLSMLVGNDTANQRTASIMLVPEGSSKAVGTLQYEEQK